MTSPSKTNIPTFNLLSIGHRGVGKTVFLVGSYAEQQINSRLRKSPIWFECQDTQVQHNLNTLLEYIAQTGQYPPATMKITNFNFITKTQNLFGEKDLCQFRWQDIPGEICNNDNPEFQKMVMESHGCCVFIDTYTLFNNHAYAQTLQGVVKQVETIASLAKQSGMTYVFAIVLTKCDLLSKNPQKLLKIEENIRPLMARLDANQIGYQRFYSTIPIVTNGKMSVLKAKGASAPLLWLSTELSKIHRKGQPQSLASGFGRLLDNSASPLKPSRSKGRSANSGNVIPLLGWTLISMVGLLGIIFALLFHFNVLRIPKTQPTVADRIQDYQQVLEEDPNDPEALSQLSKMYVDLLSYDKALPLMERLVSLQPENTFYLNELAFLYMNIGDQKKQESTYDKIIELNPKDILALTSKAILRLEQGDRKAAKALFSKAEAVAITDETKDSIRAMADEALSEANPNP